MTLFDIAAGLTLIVSGLVGWIRGGSREVAWVAAMVLAAAAALFCLRFSGPVARHAIHTVWLANIAAILIVFAAAYILFRVIASAFTNRIRRVSSLSGVDRLAGAGFGVVRGLVLLGLANLTINAIIPASRLPDWISGAWLYPLSGASAEMLKGFAPQGARLAGQVAPAIGRAVNQTDRDADAGNLPYNDASPTLRVEKKTP